MIIHILSVVSVRTDQEDDAMFVLISHQIVAIPHVGYVIGPVMLIILKMGISVSVITIPPTALLDNINQGIHATLVTLFLQTDTIPLLAHVIGRVIAATTNQGIHVSETITTTISTTVLSENTK
jgi:hypothetical protein